MLVDQNMTRDKDVFMLINLGVCGNKIYLNFFDNYAGQYFHTTENNKVFYFKKNILMRLNK